MSKIHLTENSKIYIQNRIPSMAKNIHEGNFFKKTGLLAREMGYRALDFMERQNAEDRNRTSELYLANAEKKRDIALSSAGFNVSNVKEILRTSPTSEPVLPSNATQRQQEQHDAQMELWKQRQDLERSLELKRRTNPGIVTAERDIQNIRTDFTRKQNRSSQLINPSTGPVPPPGAPASFMTPSEIARRKQELASQGIPYTSIGTRGGFRPKTWLQKADILNRYRKSLP